MIAGTGAHLRWLRPLAAQLTSAVSSILPAAATLGVTSFAALLVVRVVPFLRRGPSGRRGLDDESPLARPAWTPDGH